MSVRPTLFVLIWIALGLLAVIPAPGRALRVPLGLALGLAILGGPVLFLWACIYGARKGLEGKGYD